MDRTIGNANYNSQIKIKQTRRSGFEPAIGFGYQYDFDNGLSLNSSISLALFSDIPTPEVTIDSSELLTNEDEEELRRDIEKAYKANIHNHYHIFNLGLLYRFK